MNVDSSGARSLATFSAKLVTLLLGGVLLSDQAVPFGDQVPAAFLTDRGRFLGVTRAPVPVQQPCERDERRFRAATKLNR